MDQRGQISVEYILLAALVMLVVVVFGVVIADQSELDAVASAVRTGAENGTTQLSLLNPTMQPVRVTSVNMTGKDNVNIIVNFSSSVSSMEETILTSISQSLADEGYTTDYSGGTTLTFQTSRHTYTIKLAA